jgi:hypothetical protein
LCAGVSPGGRRTIDTIAAAEDTPGTTGIRLIPFAGGSVTLEAAEEASLRTIRRGLAKTALLACLAAGAHRAAGAYTPDNHERSVREGAQRCTADHAITIGGADLDAIIQGVREPDKLSPSLFQMVKQRFEPGAYGTRRDVSAVRIAAQSFHGSPNPTRAPYTESKEDLEKKSKTIPIPASSLLPNRLDLDVYSYDTNRAVRNRMLINASQFLCVSFAHRDSRQSARKFGNLLHMIGDTYSASHVQRSEPEETVDNCGTEKIEWHFSMDLVSWKLHGPADDNHDDWRFRCLVRHASDLMRSWDEGRRAVREQADAAAMLRRANEEVGRIIRVLCTRVFKEDPEVLGKPAGGAAAGYSIASGSDNWEFFKERSEDRPIQPVGLTGPEEAEEFGRRVSEELREKGGPAHYWYPPREAGDFCAGLDHEDPLPQALQCTPQEIDWAMSGSPIVESMWIPPRIRP